MRRWLEAVGLGLTFGRARALVVMMAVLGGWYGLCMGSYGLFLRGHPGKWLQVVAAGLKVPLVMGVTLGAAFGVSVAVNAAAGTRVPARALWGMWVRTLTVMAMVLALASPAALVLGIMGNYAACVLGNYALLAVAGSVTAAYLWKAVMGESRRGGHYGPGRWRFVALWVLCAGAFAGVGLGAGWVLRPYIGYAGQPFTWVRWERATVWEQVRAEWRNLTGR
jgi:hypothetical protein